jgi:hypothetical protein
LASVAQHPALLERAKHGIAPDPSVTEWKGSAAIRVRLRGGSHFGEDGAHSTLDTSTGHQVELNDTVKQIVVKTAGVGNPNPLITTYDDPSQAIKHAIGAAIFTVLDAINQKITHQAGTAVSTTLIDTNTVQQISHEASSTVQTTIDGVLNNITHQASPNVQTTVDGGWECDLARNS